MPTLGEHRVQLLSKRRGFIRFIKCPRESLQFDARTPTSSTYYIETPYRTCLPVQCEWSQTQPKYKKLPNNILDIHVCHIKHHQNNHSFYPMLKTPALLMIPLHSKHAASMQQARSKYAASTQQARSKRAARTQQAGSKHAAGT